MKKQKKYTCVNLEKKLFLLEFLINILYVWWTNIAAMIIFFNAFTVYNHVAYLLLAFVL